MANQPKKINLALQGGGAHGALCWGILDRLLEDGRIQFDSISATSAGAMNAVILADGLTKGGNEKARENLHAFWKSISEAGKKYSLVQKNIIEDFYAIPLEYTMGYNVVDFLTKTYSPYELNPTNFNPLLEIIEQFIDFDLLNKHQIVKLFISATNVQTGKIKVFEGNEISAKAIMASACLPFMFQAVHINNDYFWGGGYMGNPALFPLIYNSKIKDILIIHINPIIRNTIPQNSSEIMNRINEISFNSSLMREIRVIHFISDLIDKGAIKKKYAQKMKSILLHAIRADLVMKSYSLASKLNPNWTFILELFELGRIEGESWLQNHFSDVGNCSSININEYI